MKELFILALVELNEQGLNSGAKGHVVGLWHNFLIERGGQNCSLFLLLSATNNAITTETKKKLD